MYFLFEIDESNADSVQACAGKVGGDRERFVGFSVADESLLSYARCRTSENARTRSASPRNGDVTARNPLLHAVLGEQITRGSLRSTSAVLRFAGRNSRDLQWGGTLSVGSLKRTSLTTLCSALEHVAHILHTLLLPSHWHRRPAI